MISGLVLKYMKGVCFVIWRGYKYTLNGSSWFCLTAPTLRLGGDEGWVFGYEPRFH